jgi:tetratricopeptide (TPR) repeat protein
VTGVKLGRHADAVADFTQALSLEDDARTRALRGWAYLASKASALALADFDRAIQIDAGSAEAYAGRAAVRVQLAAKPSQYQEAVADAEKALSLAPRNDPRAVVNAARVHAQAAARLEGEAGFPVRKLAAGYRQEALQLLRRALEMTPPGERAAFRRHHVEQDADLARFAAALNSG